MASIVEPSKHKESDNYRTTTPSKRPSAGHVPPHHPHRHDVPQTSDTSLAGDSIDPDSKESEEVIFDSENSLTRRLVILGTVVLPLLGMITAIVLAWQFGMMNGLNLTMLIGGWYLTGMGITIGYHRMLTHRSFETTGPIRWFWTAMGALALEGSPIDWCMVHRKHHRFSDHHGDPHSPHLHGGGFWNMLKGFWHSHTGWMFNTNWSKAEREQYVPDLMEDKILMSIDNHYIKWVIATLLIPTVIGGVAALFGPTVTVSSVALGAGLGFIWGGLARVCLSHHMTWSINSICHIFGSRDFKSSDDSRNNLFFGVLSHGEGWHNNHHAFPTSARHGLKWWQFDLSWIVIRGLQKCGLAWNVKLPTDRQMETRAMK
ncbi:MAG: stearoyl-CoA desaturase (delta-9 desaturase) [Mariniblastus sp.]|jgi:stearoyl-CoA desaturase (delta-9 desaturase)